MTEEDIEQKFRKEWTKYKHERNERLHRFFIKVVVIFAILGFTVAGSVYYVYTTSDDNNDALCALYRDAEHRVILGEEFLRDNPNGIPGISVDSLRRSTHNARETMNSLSSLNCPQGEKP